MCVFEVVKCVQVCVFGEKKKVSSNTLLSLTCRRGSGPAFIAAAAFQSHISRRPHDFGVGCSVTAAEGHKDSSSLQPPRLCYRGYDSLLSLFDNVIFHARHQLSSRSSLALSSPSSPNHVPRSRLLLAPFFLSTSVTSSPFFPFSHLISSSPGDRVQVTDDSNEEWWKVGNKSFTNKKCLCRSRLCMVLSRTCINLRL